MIDKTKLRLMILSVIVRIILSIVLLYFAWKETGPVSTAIFCFCLIGLEAVAYVLKRVKERVDMSNKQFADLLPVIEGIVNEIAELKKARMNATMTISSGGVGPIDPADPLAKKQEGM
jgi:uncharacterized membrane protein